MSTALESQPGTIAVRDLGLREYEPLWRAMQRYTDRRGNDRERVIATLRGYFLTHQSIEMVTRIESVSLSGTDAAEVVLHAGVLGRREGASLVGGLEGELYRIELELVNQDGDWQVIGAHWERSLE